MKPLPEAVQRAFSSTNVLSRPWWRPSRTVTSDRGLVYERRTAGEWLPFLVYTDGVKDECRGYVPLPEDGMSLLDAMASIDAKTPLPHPGYRAGQVWAAEDGDSVVVVVLSGGLVCTAYDEEGWHPSTFARAYPFLMADPACPHLAPWSPCEGSKG